MKPIYWLLIAGVCLLASTRPTHAQEAAKKEALQVAHDFFAAMEKGDTTSFRSLFLPDARIYTIHEKDGQPRLASRSPFADRFRPGTVIKERMKDSGVEVQVQGRMAVIWAPYNLWVNNAFSHCGIDIFTLIRTDGGWKIASLSYSIEKENCEVP